MRLFGLRFRFGPPSVTSLTVFTLSVEEDSPVIIYCKLRVLRPHIKGHSATANDVLNIPVSLDITRVLSTPRPLLPGLLYCILRSRSVSSVVCYANRTRCAIRSPIPELKSTSSTPQRPPSLATYPGRFLKFIRYGLPMHIPCPPSMSRVAAFNFRISNR